MANARLSGTKIGVGALIALTLATGVATVVNLQSGEAASGPTATATSPTDGSSLTPAASYVVQLMTDRHVDTSAVAREQTLGDLLPNHLYSVAGSTPATLANGTVIGTVSKVEPGAGYVVDDANASGRQVDFTDPDAEWRVVIVTVAVESALGDVNGASSIRIAVTVNGSADVDEVLTGYAELGRIIAVLDGPGDVELDPELYDVRQGGRVFGLVADDGSITFPGFGDKDAEFRGGLNTVVDVLTEATGPDVISEVERAGAATSQD